MSTADLSNVAAYRELIVASLDRFVQDRTSTDIEPPLSETDCCELVEELKRSSWSANPAPDFAAVETVFREEFITLVASTNIGEASLGRIWILLDLVTILSDQDLCESGLGFWLVEELLDSQTIHGCRKVFDYLESRRERMTAKNFKQKSLVILRCCNELLRRLSRAEDTVFCGRVFIFMFQSFPLGDKSSVNLRGEFHVENMTTFDEFSKKSDDAIKPMEIDSSGPHVASSRSGTPMSFAADTDRSQTTGRNTPADRKVSKNEEPVDLDALYPVFWTLQSVFSSPTRLFEPATMVAFKEGIAATLSCFQRMPITSSTAASSERGVKRKRSGETEASTFNPKYLTNRDLFDLEIHDIAFRRHVLVQALILIDFLLSLTTAAKSKLAELTNKSVLYPYTLSIEDAKWATTTRARIAEYLQQGPNNEGKFYYRMVDTVLSRDKNWVRWKAENCPSISRDPVDLQTQLDAQKNLQKLCAKPRLVPPPGAADLDFLSKRGTMESLKDAKRHRIPTMEEFYKGMMNDELDAEMGTEEEIAAANEAKQAKLWRALRASGRRFHLCEKIENGKNLKALLPATEATQKGTDGEDSDREAAEEPVDQVHEKAAGDFANGQVAVET